MSEYIKREDAIATVKRMYNACEDINDYRDTLIECFKVLPLTNVVEREEANRAYCEGFKNGEEAERSRRKRGEWKPFMLGEVQWGHQCSECGKNGVGIGQYNFCPNCGADMRKGADDGTR